VRLILIRHGQTPNNVAGALDTAFPGAGLTPLGHEQAAALPAALAAEPVVALYASPLVRTQLTGAPLAASLGLDVVVEPGLEEIAAGVYEMRSDPASVAAYAHGAAAWMRGELGYRLDGGESGHEFLERYDAALAEIAARHGDDETVGVVSHGAAIRAWTAVRSREDPRDGLEARLLNTGAAFVTGDPDAGWRLDRWSAVPLGGASLLDPTAHDITSTSDEEDSVGQAREADLR